MLQQTKTSPHSKRARVLPSWPKVLRATSAAAYAAYSSERSFRAAVAVGEMPQPFTIEGADAWDIADLDASIEAIKAGGKVIGNWRRGADEHAASRRVAGRRG